MKSFFFSLLFLFTCFVQAQVLLVHELAAPNSKQHTDLNVLESELLGKRLVLLGEMTHMYGNVFEMKARVVEYLHQKLGFSTIAIEASMYEMWLMCLENPDFNPVAFKNTAVAWSEADEFDRLVNYIQDNQLKVVGFDSQIFFRTQEFIDAFFAYFHKNNIQIRIDEDDLGIAIEEAFEYGEYGEEDISFKNYRREIARLIRKIRALPDSEENFYWEQFTKNLLATSEDAYFNTDLVLTSDYVEKELNFRDKQMANNLLAYLNRYPEEKVVVWADNIHTIKDISSYTQAGIKDFKSMGSYLAKALGNEVYSLATLHANDSLFDTKKWHKTPIEKNSFEEKLSAINIPYLFVSSNQEAMREILSSRLLSFVNFYEGRVDALHDGYIFLKHASLYKKPDNKTIPNNNVQPTVSIREEVLVERSENKFTGKLIDLKTGEPIPFANIIIPDKEVYRVSDENGNYIIEVALEDDPSILVNISSMGYESLKIPISELKGVTEMSSSYQKLNEVVLTGHYTTPYKVLKKAINSIEENYMLTPLNYERFGHFTANRNDETRMDIELITKEYTRGYRQDWPTYNKVEQVKWNKDLTNSYYKSTMQLVGFREDALQFAKILDKRKYKKFELEFVLSNEPQHQDLYIIKYKNKRDRFSYTNRWYPTLYSGEIYINKNDHAIVKVIQNWESNIKEEDMAKYEPWLGKFKFKRIEKAVMISEYQKHEDGKYYASNYFKRNYTEKTNLKGEFVNTISEGSSYLSNYSQNNLEILNYENRSKNSTLDRVAYDPDFWKAYQNVEDTE